MATISQVRDGIASVVDDVTGLRVYDTIPDAFATPGAIIIPVNSVPRTLTGTRDEQNYRVLLLLANEVTRVAQDTLDGYISSTGSTSIRVKLAATSNLGISGCKATWMGVENYGRVQWDEAVYFGAEVLIQVATS